MADPESCPSGIKPAIILTLEQVSDTLDGDNENDFDTHIFLTIMAVIVAAKVKMNQLLDLESRSCGSESSPIVVHSDEESDAVIDPTD